MSRELAVYNPLVEEREDDTREPEQENQSIMLRTKSRSAAETTSKK